MNITVAIPVFNGEKYIRQAIQSVLEQTYTDYELIVTDDGSTDSSMDIVRSFSDPRLKIVSDGQHKGLAIRLNEQIAMAQGDYFARMDADDIMLPERLERQVKFLELHPETDVLGSSTIVIDENGQRIGWRGTGHWKFGAGRIIAEMDFERVDTFMHPTVIGKTAWFRTYYYNPACEGCEDMDLWFRSRNNSIFYSLYEPLLLYRDPQKINLQTYLFRRKKERYVLLINSGGLSWFERHILIFKSWIKSQIVKFSCAIKRNDIILKKRNDQRSPLNNNVLHVITSLRTGGAEKLMVELLPRLQKLGVNAELLVFDGIRTPFFDQLEKTGIKINMLRVGGSVYDLRNIFALIPYLRRNDVIHTHNTAPQMFVAMANRLLLKKHRPKLVTTEHSTSNRRRNYPSLKRLDRWMYKQYCSLICVSDIAADNIKQYVACPNLPTITIPNGIDVGRFSKAVPTSDIVEKYSNCYKAIMVAGFRYEKDQKTIIKAFGLLNGNYHLFFAGDGEKRAECELLADKLNIRDRVHFLGIRSDIPNLLKTADIVIMSSHREGLSLSNLEGMASGRPFIASDVDGLHEIVAGYGVLVPHKDPQAMADAIKKLATDTKYAQEVAQRCVERARMFDIETMAEKYNALYQ